MAYESVDKLQNALGEQVFHYTQDKKKAAGRALGTLVEIITYYLLKTWGFNNSTSIERGLVEYGNEDISHNVEYSLHPIINVFQVKLPNNGKSLTSTKILNELENQIDISFFKKKNNNLLDKHNILRNACTIAESENTFLLTSIKSIRSDEFELLVFEQMYKPYAIFECKRVGIEEGTTKEPQTIEKAKQGAYVARTASSLQKIRTDKGEKYELIFNPSSDYKCVQEAFMNSYTAKKKRNVFTKVKMDIKADEALLKYFSDNIHNIESWFNVITPVNKSIGDLRSEIAALRTKNWREIL
jgi:hypothetical protein